MTTYTIMKERIASELRRSDLSSASEFKVTATTSDIEDAILTAIEEFQGHRFWFNESRELNFLTTTDQDLYDSDDDADIPLILKIDYVTITVGGQPYQLIPARPEQLEVLNGNTSYTGQPEFYCWYGDQIRLSPIPNTDDWVVRVGAVMNKAAPASGSEASNVWMTKAEKLIRSYAKMELYLHVIQDLEQAQVMKSVVADTLRRMDQRTADALQVGDAAEVEAWG